MPSRLTPQQKRQLRRMIEATHIEAVMLELSEICRKHEKHCLATPDLGAIAVEWRVAAKYLEAAAEEVQE